MEIDNIEIEIKKYDQEKNFAIVNLIVFKKLEIRGCTVRYTTTKHSPSKPVWIVTPPSVRGRNKAYFHVVWFKDGTLWSKLELRIIKLVKEHVEEV